MLLQHAEINQDFRRKKTKSKLEKPIQNWWRNKRNKSINYNYDITFKNCMCFTLHDFLQTTWLETDIQNNTTEKSSKTALKSHNKRSDLTTKKLYVFFYI